MTNWRLRPFTLFVDLRLDDRNSQLIQDACPLAILRHTHSSLVPPSSGGLFGSSKKWRTSCGTASVAKPVCRALFKTQMGSSLLGKRLRGGCWSSSTEPSIGQPRGVRRRQRQRPLRSIGTPNGNSTPGGVKRVREERPSETQGKMVGENGVRSYLRSATS